MNKTNTHTHYFADEVLSTGYTTCDLVMFWLKVEGNLRPCCFLLDDVRNEAILPSQDDAKIHLDYIYIYT